MLCSRLVKYESSIGGVSLKAIRSLNDGNSSCNLLRLHLAYFSVIIIEILEISPITIFIHSIINCFIRFIELILIDSFTFLINLIFILKYYYKFILLNEHPKENK